MKYKILYQGYDLDQQKMGFSYRCWHEEMQRTIFRDHLRWSTI
ncbi:MAG: hypothetical protein ACQEP8_00165 [Chlamydiota bacterium]